MRSHLDGFPMTEEPGASFYHDFLSLRPPGSPSLLRALHPRPVLLKKVALINNSQAL